MSLSILVSLQEPCLPTHVIWLRRDISLAVELSYQNLLEEITRRL